jgi:nucleotide-binding universal stress UspA family protein
MDADKKIETDNPQMILVATDFSSGSDQALDQAIRMAKVLGARVALAHVIEPAIEFPMGTAYSDIDGGYFASVDLALEARAAKVEKAGLRCTTKILEGPVASELTQWAGQLGARMIIVGTHGRTGLSHVLLGSVAEKVVRHAACPVLTVPYARKAA